MRDGADVTDPVINDGTANYTPGISERRSSTTKFVHSDQLGSTTALTNSSQSVTDTRQYDAFGMLVSSTGSTVTPFGFAGGHGYQTDRDSGLMLLGHRYYDPSTGRFLSRDPVGAGRNWCSYCEDNPLELVDPSGLDWIWHSKSGRLDWEKGGKGTVRKGVGHGYSGNGPGKNNPSMQSKQGIGPIPAGKWKIHAPHKSPNTGPYVLKLTPRKGTNTFGRGGELGPFEIHGERKPEHGPPGCASDGCIVLPRKVREIIWKSGDHDLDVVPD